MGKGKNKKVKQVNKKQDENEVQHQTKSATKSSPVKKKSKKEVKTVKKSSAKTEVGITKLLTYFSIVTVLIGIVIYSFLPNFQQQTHAPHFRVVTNKENDIFDVLDEPEKCSIKKKDDLLCNTVSNIEIDAQKQPDLEEETKSDVNTNNLGTGEITKNISDEFGKTNVDNEPYEHTSSNSKANKNYMENVAFENEEDKHRKSLENNGQEDIATKSIEGVTDPKNDDVVKTDKESREHIEQKDDHKLVSSDDQHFIHHQPSESEIRSELTSQSDDSNFITSDNFDNVAIGKTEKTKIVIEKDEETEEFYENQNRNQKGVGFDQNNVNESINKVSQENIDREDIHISEADEDKHVSRGEESEINDESIKPIEKTVSTLTQDINNEKLFEMEKGQEQYFENEKNKSDESGPQTNKTIKPDDENHQENENVETNGKDLENIRNDHLNKIKKSEDENDESTQNDFDESPMKLEQLILTKVDKKSENKREPDINRLNENGNVVASTAEKAENQIENVAESVNIQDDNNDSERNQLKHSDKEFPLKVNKETHNETKDEIKAIEMEQPMEEDNIQSPGVIADSEVATATQTSKLSSSFPSTPPNDASIKDEEDSTDVFLHVEESSSSDKFKQTTDSNLDENETYSPDNNFTNTTELKDIEENKEEDEEKINGIGDSELEDDTSFIKLDNDVEDVSEEADTLFKDSNSVNGNNPGSVIVSVVKGVDDDDDLTKGSDEKNIDIENEAKKESIISPEDEEDELAKFKSDFFSENKDDEDALLNPEEEDVEITYNTVNEDIPKEYVSQAYHVQEKRIKIIKDSEYKQISDGVKKHVIREGFGRKLRQGDQVTLHCMGYIDRQNPKLFWNTKELGQRMFTFVLGEKQVIKGWDDAVASMKLNEKSKFKIEAKKAYGKFGFKAWDIPPNANIMMEFELVSIKARKQPIRYRL